MGAKKRGLGRGLAALISDEGDVEEGKNQENLIVEININLIKPNKYQPRIDFDKDKLLDLTNSIKNHGIIQPIIVRKIEDKEDNYEIVAGERRWRASKLAGLDNMPCIVKDLDSELSSKYALIENIQREDLNPVEEGKAYKQLIDKYELTQEQLAKEVGKSRSYITNSIRLLNLNKEVLKYIYDGKISLGHGKVLLAMKDKKDQLLIANKIIEENLNIRQIEDIIKNKEPEKIETKDKKKRNKDPHIIALEDNLMSILGTKVNLITGRKKGKIEIEYYGLEDLDRILDILKNE